MLLPFLIFISSLWAIEFEFNMSTEIMVEVNGHVLTNPFAGGLNKPKVQWIDWDADGDRRDIRIRRRLVVPSAPAQRVPAGSSHQRTLRAVSVGSSKRRCRRHTRCI